MINADNTSPTGAPLEKKYWNSRKNSLYYSAVYQFVSVVGEGATSILDVGSADSDFINWFQWIPDRTQLNLGFKSETPPGIKRIKADFFEWYPESRYDVVLCMQVLEHIEDIGTFCEKLKATARRLVVSVPYKWRESGTPGHVHDPVDEQKLKSWMGVSPNYDLIVREPFGPSRYIAFYDIENGPSNKFPPGYAKELILKRAV